MKLPPINFCNRVNFILGKTLDKKVLYLGYADYNFTENLIHQGELLHQQMSKAKHS
ncbi:hypothetical protein [Calothrix rhizosoleniae]|uniref:hypothetical protein n=1 Tax=Calothrix rhizosoleniae TaxID=888997 RepID=UPI0013562A39|nr:hypothetical protein [Calothrix rhizosoleniae]